MFTDELWESWLENELKNYESVLDEDTGRYQKKYLKKGYIHFDPKIWLPGRKDEIRKLLSNSIKVAQRAFYPFIKTIVKTPRYRYSEKKGKRALEHKKRPICYASHMDSLIYSFYGFCLNEKYQEYIKETKIDSLVLAYRTDLGKCNIEFASEAFELIKRRKKCTAITLDIKGFFDNLDHHILLENWKKVLGVESLPDDQYKVYKSLCNYAYVNKNTLLEYLKLDLKRVSPKPKTLIDPSAKNFKILRERNIIVNNKEKYGIPQGSGISGVLSNIYMIDFDRYMLRQSRKWGFNYFRYCDDILIICDSPKANLIAHLAYKKIKDYKLQIQAQKEDKISFRRVGKSLKSFDARKLNKFRFLSAPPHRRDEFFKRLQYLGFEFDGKDMFIRSSTMSRYYRRMNSRIANTLYAAYGRHSRGTKVFTKKLLSRNTHLGKNNFISYGYRSMLEENEKIRRQLRRHDVNFHKILKRKNALHALREKKPTKSL